MTTQERLDRFVSHDMARRAAALAEAISAELMAAHYPNGLFGAETDQLDNPAATVAGGYCCLYHN